MTTAQDELLTPQEVRDWFRLASVGVLYQWKFKGYGPRAIRVGKHLRYSRIECEQFLEEQASGARAG
jgi:hypothetical protein